MSPKGQKILKTRYKHLINELSVKKKSVDFVVPQFQMKQLTLPNNNSKDLSAFSAKSRSIKIDAKMKKKLKNDIQISEGGSTSLAENRNKQVKRQSSADSNKKIEVLDQ